jgi:hypothetical protein
MVFWQLEFSVSLFEKASALAYYWGQANFTLYLSASTIHMHLESKKARLLILGVTSILCSRLVFFFFDDPEGSNLLVVMGLAIILYLLSLISYSLLSLKNPERLLLVIIIQIAIATGIYFCL